MSDPNASQIKRMSQQRKASYGLIPPAAPSGFVLVATGVTAAMVGGNVTVFPLGASGVVPTDQAIMTQRMVPGGTLGDTNVDTLSSGVGGSFRIHSTSGTETSTWRWFMFSALAAE